MILLVSCPYGNHQSSRYTKAITIKLQYNGFFTNDIIFNLRNHDATAWIYFDEGVWKWTLFAYLVSITPHILLSPVFHLNINKHKHHLNITFSSDILIWLVFHDNFPYYFCGVTLHLHLPEFLRKFRFDFVKFVSERWIVVV